MAVFGIIGIVRAGAKVATLGKAGVKPAAFVLGTSFVGQRAVSAILTKLEPADTLLTAVGQPTKKESAAAINRAIERGRSGSSVKSLARDTHKAITEAGLAPFLPGTRAELAWRVLEDQGKPAWIVAIPKVLDVVTGL